MTRPVVRRAGSTLKVKGRPIPFSVYPVTRTTRRFGLQSRIFASSPWGIMRQAIENTLTGTAREEANAFLSQADSFYQIAESSHLSPTKPLLYYYSFLNIVKAFALVKGTATTYGRAVHGLVESTPPGGTEFHDSIVTVNWHGASPRLYNDLKKTLTGRTDPKNRAFQLKNVMPQLLPGHRVWCEASGSKERFVEIQRIDFRYDEASKEIWSEINIFSDDLTRFGITRDRLLSESGLSATFQEAQSAEVVGDRKLLKFQQVAPVRYTGRPSDKIDKIVALLKPYLWSSALSVPPYRKNYLYLCPPSDRAEMLPQILSIYVTFFYLGSVTRYRPNFFEKILETKHGSHIQEVILNLPQQFLYLLASEFAGREVAHAPLV
nr:YaaC family protein [Frateuria soli]